jgi:hypothetical protein
MKEIGSMVAKTNEQTPQRNIAEEQDKVDKKSSFQYAPWRSGTEQTQDCVPTTNCSSTTISRARHRQNHRRCNEQVQRQKKTTAITVSKMTTRKMHR